MTDVRHDRGSAGRTRDAWVEPGQDLDDLLARWGSAQDGPFRAGGRHAAAAPSTRFVLDGPGEPSRGRHGSAGDHGGGGHARGTYGGSSPTGRANGGFAPAGAGRGDPSRHGGYDPPVERDAGPGWPADDRDTGSGGRRSRPDHVPPPAWATRPAAPGRLSAEPAAPNGAPAAAPPAARHQALLSGPGLTATAGLPSLPDAGSYAAWLNGGAPGGVGVLDRPVADARDLLTHDPDRWAFQDVPPPPPGRRRHAAGRSRYPRWLQVLGWVGAFVGVLALAGGSYGLYQYHKLSGNIRRVDALSPDDAAIRDAAKQLDAENYLLIGSDTRAGANRRYEDSAGQVTGERSDTTILAHLSPDREKAVLVSFPRDSWVRLPACRKKDGTVAPERDGQFNEAFATGGPACTVLAVQKLTGIKINHYVQVDFTGFKTMVDAVGGVPICSTTPLRDSESGLRLNPGTSVLHGEQALAYVRARYGIGDGSDLGRIQRQQRFLGAMVRKATSTKLLVNPVALTRFLDAATKSLTLDRSTSFGDLKALADQLRDLDPKRVSFLTAPIADGAYNPPGFPDPPPGRAGSKVLLDAAAGRRLWDSIINDRPAPKGAPTRSTSPKPNVLTVAPEDVTVRVLNGVGIDGLARKVGGELESAGFQTVEPTNGPRTTATTVRYGPAHAAAARTLGAAVPGAVLQPDAGTTLDLVVGDNYTGVVTVQPGDPATAKTAAAPKREPSAPKSSPVINAADTRCS